MAYKYLNIEHAPDGLVGVTVVRFVNPPLHTITLSGALELSHFLSDLQSELDAGTSNTRVLVLTGGAEAKAANIFVRSYDVGELSASASGRPPTSSSGRPVENAFHAVTLALEAMPLITVAAINGLAMGGGCELTLACDFRLLSDKCPGYGLPETSVGVLPGGGGTQRLARMLGTAKAMDLIIHSKLLKPADALAVGMVHRVFPAADFEKEWRNFASDLAHRAPVALAASKICIQQGVQLSLEEGLKLEGEFRKCMKSDDAKQALANVAYNKAGGSLGVDVREGGKYKSATDPGFVWASKYPAARL